MPNDPAVTTAATTTTEPAVTTAAVTTAAVAPAAPIAYDYALPEGYKRGEGLAKEFEDFAGAVKAEGGKAEAMFKSFIKHSGDKITSVEQALATAAKTQADKWVGDWKADAEIGGANMEASIQTAKKAVGHFFGAEFSKFLDTSGLGNHPAMAKGLIKIAKAFGEDKMIGSSATPADAKSAADTLYPNQAKKP